METQKEKIQVKIRGDEDMTNQDDKMNEEIWEEVSHETKFADPDLSFKDFWEIETTKAKIPKVLAKYFKLRFFEGLNKSRQQGIEIGIQKERNDQIWKHKKVEDSARQESYEQGRKDVLNEISEIANNLDAVNKDIRQINFVLKQLKNSEAKGK